MTRPWKNSVVFKFFISYLIIVSLLFLVFYFYSASILKAFYLQTLSDKLQEEARMLSRLMPSGSEGQALDQLCRDLTQDRKLRITVIAPDGKVLGDS